MKIKFLSKEYTVKLNELSSQSIGGLKEQIKKTIKECESKQDDKILLFHNKVKLPEDPSTELSDERLKITDDSTVFVVAVPGQTSKAEEKPAAKAPASTASQTATPHTPQTPSNMPPGFPFPQMRMPGMEGGQDANGAPAKYIEKMLEDPEAIIQAMELQFPNMSEEQKSMIRQHIDMMKNNPELIGQVINNPMMRNPYMMPQMGSPMYNPYAMGSPMYPPWGAPMTPQMETAPPSEGPCSHGFYPPRYVQGEPQPQDARDVWTKQIADLKEMGFTDEEENIKALRKAKGDIGSAIGFLTEYKDKQ